MSPSFEGEERVCGHAAFHASCSGGRRVCAHVRSRAGQRRSRCGLSGSRVEAVRSLERLREVRVRTEWRLRKWSGRLDAYRGRAGRSRERILQGARRRRPLLAVAPARKHRDHVADVHQPLLGEDALLHGERGRAELEAQGAGLLQRRRRQPARRSRSARSASPRSATPPGALPGSPARRSGCSAAPCPLLTSSVQFRFSTVDSVGSLPARRRLPRSVPVSLGEPRAFNPDGGRAVGARPPSCSLCARRELSYVM